MFNLIKRYQKHRSIKKYIRNLGPSLKKRYGFSEYYTEGQIKTTMEKSKIGGQYASYAYGLYLAPRELEGVLERLYEAHSSKKMRVYLATHYVGGSLDYSYSDIMATSCYQEGSDSGDGGEGDGGGGDGGGGD